MKPEYFIAWLRGYIELDGRVPTPRQWQIIQDHLNLVFDKKTPDRKNIEASKEATYCSPRPINVCNYNFPVESNSSGFNLSLARFASNQPTGTPIVHYSC